ncbi:K88 pilin [Edwardsiella tarda]|uniref:Uncharacterized protein n=1 Tax=Edwardsiella tarda ATCC 15947 = NBRC 105688 TaxID=667121 RepID=A0AC61TMV1_EDWTA|nr:hypothetical protein [Edwardsiella tarda]UAL58111.1 hypothetical protein K8O98_17280 [Edwardsiella tarda]UCQ02028.1 hypothetical protein DCL27_17115 [Edwardsiella tarda ATCC 15947 = NBRC 105688]STE53111.1 K88 pilin [Edwardsiella tarda]
MKKNLITLTVAISAAVSGSAMAWTANSLGGSVEFGGTLTPADIVTPWEVYIGSPVNNINADIKKGSHLVDIPVVSPIPILGIRTTTSSPIKGQPGISPQIDFQGTVDISKIKDNEAVFHVDVVDVSNSKVIGMLSAPLLVAAEYSYTGRYDGAYMMHAQNEGDAFFGGLPPKEGGISPSIRSRIENISPDFVRKYNNQGFPNPRKVSNAWNFADGDYYISAFYGAGIEQGKLITLTLDTPITTSDSITWKASLPITISYR